MLRAEFRGNPKLLGRREPAFAAVPAQRTGPSEAATAGGESCIMIVIGLGTGRSGTNSLSTLIRAQRDAFCFHEMNPACVRFAGTPRPILNAVDEFQAVLDGGEPSNITVDITRPVVANDYDKFCKMTKLRLIGDVAL